MSTVEVRFAVCALTLVAVAGSSSAQGRARSLAARVQAQVTTSGHDTSPVYSPDSRRIAFISYRSNQVGDIFVMNADGTAQAGLTNGAHSWIREGSIAWSPDGKQIVFVGQPQDGDSFDIFLVNADGGADPVNLTNTPGVYDDDARWSPNGAKIAFTSVGGIYVMSADGSELTRLTNDPPMADVSPAWSPNGQEIAFVRHDDLNQASYICVMSADGTNQRQLTDDPAFDDASPLWSPDGRAISFARAEHGGSFSILVMGRDGGSAASITGRIRVEGPGVWSPNGKRIAFASQNRLDAAGDIYVVNADGTGLINLTNSSSVLDYGPPSWSHNGARLIFWSTATGWPDGNIFSAMAAAAAIAR